MATGLSALCAKSKKTSFLIKDILDNIDSELAPSATSGQEETKRFSTNYCQSTPVYPGSSIPHKMTQCSQDHPNFRTSALTLPMFPHPYINLSSVHTGYVPY
ncbi:hypothetical protein BgiMline_030357, partial [Biomphalaria glabrata]